jgi:hypothetical protein
VHPVFFADYLPFLCIKLGGASVCFDPDSDFLATIFVQKMVFFNMQKAALTNHSSHLSGNSIIFMGKTRYPPSLSCECKRETASSQAKWLTLETFSFLSISVVALFIKLSSGL